MINREHKDQYKAEPEKNTASQEVPDLNRRKSMITSSIFGKLMSKKEEKKQSPTNRETGAKGLASIQLSAAMKGIGNKSSESNVGQNSTNFLNELELLQQPSKPNISQVSQLDGLESRTDNIFGSPGIKGT